MMNFYFVFFSSAIFLLFSVFDLLGVVCQLWYVTEDVFPLEFFADYMVVNGMVTPYLEVEPTRYRSGANPRMTRMTFYQHHIYLHNHNKNYHKTAHDDT